MPGDILAVQFDKSLIRLIYTGQQVEYRCLTGPIWSDQPIKLAFIYTYLEIINRLKAAKGYA